MAEPKIRFKRDDGSSYPEWKGYLISDLFSKIGMKNKDGKNTNVITNSAEFGLIPQRDFFDKDIAVEGRTENYTIIQTGDFVYNPRKSSYAPMGPFNCYRLEEDGIVSPLYSCLRPKGILNPEYLLWYFQTDKWYGYVNDHGAQNGARHDRVGMTDSILMGIPVTAPCDEEQQKIADCLSAVDEVISASQQEVANLEIQKQAVMKKIFSQEVRFKREDGTDFPEWEEDYVGNRCKIQTGKSNTQDAIEDGEYPFYVRSPLIYRSKRYLFDTEAVITVGDGVGTGKVYHYVNGKFDLHQRAYALTDFIGVTGKYFYCYFSANFYERVRAMTAKTSVDSVRYDMIDKMKIKIPCIEEQYLIANFLSDFDEAIAAAKKELELWKELKKGLLQQMFV